MLGSLAYGQLRRYNPTDFVAPRRLSLLLTRTVPVNKKVLPGVVSVNTKLLMELFWSFL